MSAKTGINIGQIICKRRLQLGMSVQTLAEKAGISERWLRNIENGKANPTLKTVIAIAKVLQLSMGDLDVCMPDDNDND